MMEDPPPPCSRIAYDERVGCLEKWRVGSQMSMRLCDGRSQVTYKVLK